MDQTQFDALEYFATMAKKNKLVKKENFKVDFCSGPGGLEPVMASYRNSKNFILIDDTTSSNTFSNRTGWFDRQVYCVNIIAGYKFGDAQDYARALNLCRRIFRQFLSRVIRDKEAYTYGSSLLYLNTGNVYSNEFGRYSFNGATGLFFQIQNDEPTDLIFSTDDWED